MVVCVKLVTGENIRDRRYRPSNRSEILEGFEFHKERMGFIL